MKAYAVFDGGGVKGCALAGGLAAAADQGITFVGFGGTSAGSIIATLAAAGYSGADIWHLMKTSVHPKTMLEDGGALLEAAVKTLEETIQIVESDAWGFTKCRAVQKAISSEPARRLLADLGLYPGQSLKDTLSKLIRGKVPTLKDVDPITFEHFRQAGLPDLRIVASNLSNPSPVVFGRPERDETVFSGVVLSAVRASASYPLLYAPVTFDDTMMSDGGLASNLPTFLFAEDAALTQYPIIAFDLVAKPQRVGAGLIPFLQRLLDVALNSSDQLANRIVPGVVRIPIEVPDTISTLKFDLTPTEIDLLYAAGYRDTAAYLRDFQALQKTREAGANIQAQLQFQYGGRPLFEPVLMGLAGEMSIATKAREIRSQIMLPTGRPGGSRIVVFHQGFRVGDADSALELSEFGGCSGRTLEKRQPSAADLVEAKEKFATWGMTREQQNAVAQDRRTMLSVPIFAWSERVLPPDRHPIIGVLSVDSSTPHGETGWVAPDNATIIESPAAIMTKWARIVSKLLQ